MPKTRIASSRMMTNQQMLNTLEASLRVLKNRPCPGRQYQDPSVGGEGWICPHPEHGYSALITDPRYQAAWELVVQEWMPIEGNRQFWSLNVGSWPPGAVRGLLEQVMETLTLSVEGPQINAVGGKFRWWGDAPSLAQAIMEALNEQRQP